MGSDGAKPAQKFALHLPTQKRMGAEGLQAISMKETSLFRTIYHLMHPLWDPIRMVRNCLAYPGYVRDMFRYRNLPNAEPRSQWHFRPILDDKTSTSGFDAHYVYLGAWAFRQIASRRPSRHVDVGSQISWVTCVAGMVDAVFIDIRPFTGRVEGLSSVAGSVLAMPYEDQTLESLSCLHVAEHIGLGRYGDPLDPNGTRAAIRELARVVAPGGSLYFALPIGSPQIVFNAHRVHCPWEIIRLFGDCGLTLQQFAAVDDDGAFHPKADIASYEKARYACGMFHFMRDGATTLKPG